MFELMVSIPTALLRFKDLKAVSNYSVVKLESFMASLKDIKYSLKFVETGGKFFAREGSTFVTKELNLFAICSAEYNDLLLTFSALEKVLFFFFLFYWLFLLLIAMISWYFLGISICKKYFFLFLLTY